MKMFYSWRPFHKINNVSLNRFLFFLSSKFFAPEHKNYKHLLSWDEKILRKISEQFLDYPPIFVSCHNLSVKSTTNFIYS